jgi:diketogulonate reductase-like aldo/keto reductase
LVRTRRFDDPKLIEIAKRYGKTPAQILIRWALQENIIVIPKSSNPKRIQENADVFDFSISATDMESINTFNENLIVCWDPMKTP